MIAGLLLACAARGPVVAGGPSPAVGEDPQLGPTPPAELIYFALVDRFANGDPGNDQASPGPAVDLADPQAWHGGDLAGLRQHLDHIQALGATTLWISPVFRTRTAPIGQWGAFHGYWQWDPLSVEPRFGTREELEGLGRDLQARGMGLLLDLVTNHVGYDAPLERAHPDWFHGAPSIEDWSDRRQLEDGRVHGLPDLDQDHPEVAAWLHQVAATWQDLPGLRGYRVDAVRHVPNTFLAELGGAVVARDPGAWWLGEDFTGDVGELALSQRTGGFTHVFDFPLHYAMTEVFCDDAAPARLASVLGQDGRYARPEGLVTFLDNHDLPRIRSRCHGDEGRVFRALAFLLTARGVPALTWGTEAGLEGAHEPHNRGDMRLGTTALGQWIGRLAELRASYPALRTGAARTTRLEPDLVVLARVHGAQAALVAVNRGPQSRPVDLPPPLSAMRVVHHLAQGGEGLPGSSATPGGAAWPEETREVPARGIAVWVLEGPADPWPTGEVDLAVEVAGAPEGQVRLVGADPLLGTWDPARAPRLDCAGGRCRGTLRVPQGTVLEGKPVHLGADGTVTWADGANRAVLAEPGVAWRLDW
ncbi:glycosyl hydrolase [Myxococcota bacterium]|nr:glycosyl hydrolase [Myxococcota bacterium]